MASFPRENRLTCPAEFQHVFQRGKHRRLQSDGFLLRVRAGTHSAPRLGLAISKRALRRAVDRNRVKRLVRESFRHQIEELPAIDIVVMAQSGLASVDNAVILQQLDGLWTCLREYAAAGKFKQPHST